jgi:hypothetical protein
MAASAHLRISGNATGVRHPVMKPLVMALPSKGPPGPQPDGSCAEDENQTVALTNGPENDW